MLLPVCLPGVSSDGADGDEKATKKHVLRMMVTMMVLMVTVVIISFKKLKKSPVCHL